MVRWSDMPRSLGHVFYDRLQWVLIDGGFDACDVRQGALIVPDFDQVEAFGRGRLAGRAAVAPGQDPVQLDPVPLALAGALSCMDASGFPRGKLI